jgi:hypothetical protein
MKQAEHRRDKRYILRVDVKRGPEMFVGDSDLDNAGVRRGFCSLFLHLIQDLNAQHIVLLKRLQSREIRDPKGDGLLVVQMLTASGLATETLIAPQIQEPRFGSGIPSVSEVNHIWTRFIRDLQHPPERVFRLSTLGRDFLNFVSLSRITD